MRLTVVGRGAPDPTAVLASHLLGDVIANVNGERSGSTICAKGRHPGRLIVLGSNWQQPIQHPHAPDTQSAIAHDGWIPRFNSTRNALLFTSARPARSDVCTLPWRRCAPPASGIRSSRDMTEGEPHFRELEPDWQMAQTGGGPSRRCLIGVDDASRL